MAGETSGLALITDSRSCVCCRLLHQNELGSDLVPVTILPPGIPLLEDRLEALFSQDCRAYQATQACCPGRSYDQTSCMATVMEDGGRCSSLEWVQVLGYLVLTNAVVVYKWGSPALPALENLNNISVPIVSRWRRFS